MRLRAQQSCPALSKTLIGLSSTNRSRSASAKQMFGLLPPSSSEIRFTFPAARRMTSWPVPVSPVRATLPMPGCDAIADPTDVAGPRHDVEDTGGQAGLERELREAQRRRGASGRRA